MIIKNAINGAVNSVMTKVERGHKKKFANLQEEKRKRDGITKNPNQCIINLSGRVLTEEEYGASQYGLNKVWNWYTSKRHDCICRVLLGTTRKE